MKTPNQFVIGAYTGGGVLGYGQAIFMSYLEQKYGILAYRIFDMFAGTSVGSFIAAASSLGIPMSQVKSFFTIHAPKIFHQTLWEEIESAANPKYSATALEEGLKDLFTICDPSGTARQATLSDCKTKLVIPAVDMRSGKPVHFKSYENSSENEDEIIVGPDSGIELWQVCRASSAAQTYFPAFMWNNYILWDGGNSSDNAPDVLAFMEAEQWTTKEQMQMLSLGTGSSPWTLDATKLITPSPIRAAFATIELLFAAGVSADVAKARRALGNRHYRVTPNFAGQTYKIDDASQKTLDALAGIWQSAITKHQATIEEFGSLSQPVVNQ